MNVMLLAIFAAAGLGVVAKKFARREMNLALAIATVLTVAYFVHPVYMT